MSTLYTQRFPSRSRDGVSHLLRVTEDYRYLCTCEGAQTGHICRHMREAKVLDDAFHLVRCSLCGHEADQRTGTFTGMWWSGPLTVCADRDACDARARSGCIQERIQSVASVAAGSRPVVSNARTTANA